MTFNELAKMVAEKIEAEVREHGFGTFAEMKQCYMMDSKDVKYEEFECNIRDIAKETGENAFIDEYDGNYVWIGDEMMPYRKFNALTMQYVRDIENGREINVLPKGTKVTIIDEKSYAEGQTGTIIDNEGIYFYVRIGESTLKINRTQFKVNN